MLECRLPKCLDPESTNYPLKLNNPVIHEIEGDPKLAFLAAKIDRINFEALSTILKNLPTLPQLPDHTLIISEISKFSQNSDVETSSFPALCTLSQILFNYEIETGGLECPNCHFEYPIVNTIPRMMYDPSAPENQPKNNDDEEEEEEEEDTMNLQTTTAKTEAS